MVWGRWRGLGREKKRNVRQLTRPPSYFKTRAALPHPKKCDERHTYIPPIQAAAASSGGRGRIQETDASRYVQLLARNIAWYARSESGDLSVRLARKRTITFAWARERRRARGHASVIAVCRRSYFLPSPEKRYVSHGERER